MKAETYFKSPLSKGKKTFLVLICWAGFLSTVYTLIYLAATVHGAFAIPIGVGFFVLLIMGMGAG